MGKNQLNLTEEVNYVICSKSITKYFESISKYKESYIEVKENLKNERRNPENAKDKLEVINIREKIHRPVRRSIAQLFHYFCQKIKSVK